MPIEEASLLCFASESQVTAFIHQRIYIFNSHNKGICTLKAFADAQPIPQGYRAWNPPI